MSKAYLVKVDDWLPELVLGLVEVSHTDFTEVTRVVLVEIGSVVVLTTGHTTTTGVLPVLAYTTVTGRDMAAATKKNLELAKAINRVRLGRRLERSGQIEGIIDSRSTYCFLVFVNRVGILIPSLLVEVGLLCG